MVERRIGLLEGSVLSNLSVMLKHYKTKMLSLKCSKPWENIFERKAIYQHIML